MNPEQGKTDVSYLDGRIISGDVAITAKLLSRARPRWRYAEIVLVTVLPFLIVLGILILWSASRLGFEEIGPFFLGMWPGFVILVWFALMGLHRAAHRRIDALADLVERMEKRHQSQAAVIPEA